MANTQDINPTVIVDLILLKTNAFLVRSEQMNDERYNAVIADRYLKWEMLWNDFMKYG